LKNSAPRASLREVWILGATSRDAQLEQIDITHVALEALSNRSLFPSLELVYLAETDPSIASFLANWRALVEPLGITLEDSEGRVPRGPGEVICSDEQPW
jgi:hypothetical protein